MDYRQTHTQIFFHLIAAKNLTHRRLAEEIKKTNLDLRSRLKKVTTLEKKYGKLARPQTGKEELDSDMLKGVGALTIFDDNCSIKPEEIKKPVIVESFGEKIILSADETEVLTLGPKYNLYSRITEENLEVEVEEMIMKVKWDMMGDVDKEETKNLEDVALEVLLGKYVCEGIDRENDEKWR